MLYTFFFPLAVAPLGYGGAPVRPRHAPVASSRAWHMPTPRAATAANEWLRTEALIASHCIDDLPPRLIRTATESMTYFGVEVL